jgi:hypothetical protein
MKTIIKFFVVLNIALLLTGCAADVMKAPCDQQGHFCGRKIKINQW